MPIYEYVCLDCGNLFDLMKPMTHVDQPESCTKCKGNNTHRKLSVFHAQSNGKNITENKRGSCSGCGGGSCSSCSH